MLHIAILLLSGWLGILVIQLESCLFILLFIVGRDFKLRVEITQDDV